MGTSALFDKKKITFIYQYNVDTIKCDEWQGRMSRVNQRNMYCWHVLIKKIKVVIDWNKDMQLRMVFLFYGISIFVRHLIEAILVEQQ